jgi:hypothetical protein
MPRSFAATGSAGCAAALLLVGSGAPLRAQTADSAAAVAAVHELLDAMQRRDTAAARALLVPGARFVSVRGDSAETPRVQTDGAFLRSLVGGRARLQERVWAPVVRVHGPLATVWAPYDFHVDGRRTHCGVDAFTLLWSGSRWRVAGITYTVERHDCPASPLGPPK